MAIIVLCPTRNRPERALELQESFEDTISKTNFTASLVFAVDNNDPKKNDYFSLVNNIVILNDNETGNLTKATNYLAARFWDLDLIFGHVGDDHRFITPDWDIIIEQVLAQPGVAYGNDLIQGEKLPTAVFINSIIPRTLGWFALPACQHLNIDNAWKDIGNGIGRLTYLPDLIIKHEHPAGNFIPWDEDYLKVNTLANADSYAYGNWVRNEYSSDISKIKFALGIV